MDDNSTTKKYKFHQNNIDQQIIHSTNSDNIWVIKRYEFKHIYFISLTEKDPTSCVFLLVFNG